MLIEETYINASKNYLIGESGLSESSTDNIQRLFGSYQKEYGRCVSKVYYDKPDGSAMPIGWVFEKRMKYTDCNDTYIQQTWVILHKENPTKTIEYHYQELKG